MKKLLFLAILSLAFAACEDDKFILPAGTTVSIKPAPGAWDSPQKIKGEEPTSQYLSAIEIVRQAVGISFQNSALFDDRSVDRGFSKEQRDTISDPPCLKMWATDIISMFGDYDPTFIGSTDCVLIRALSAYERDTIGYIPNSVLRAAEVQIKAAYDAQDYESVYQLFDEAFTFYPVTGAEWRALKAENLQ